MLLFIILVRYDFNALQRKLKNHYYLCDTTIAGF